VKILIIVGIILLVLLAILGVLYYFGNKMQKKQLEQREEITAAAQPVSMFIIDKKIMPMKDAKLPKAVMDQAPKRYQKAKIPVVKAKIGPQITTLICDEAIYSDVPSHGEVKAMVSGIYLTSVKTLHKATKKKQQEEAAAVDEKGRKKKKSRSERLIERQAEYQKQLQTDIAMKKSKADEKAARAEEKRRREREKKIVD